MLFCLLTDHEVYYAAVYTQGDDSHRSKINEHLGQKEDGSTIVATHILMAVRENREYNFEFLRVKLAIFTECVNYV